MEAERIYSPISEVAEEEILRVPVLESVNDLVDQMSKNKWTIQ